MKRKAMLAAVLASVCLMAGCSSTQKETEKETTKQTETTAAAETEAVTAAQTEAATEAAIAEAATEAVVISEEKAEEISEAASNEMLEDATEGISEAAEEATLDELATKPEYNALDYVTLGAYEGLTVQVDPLAEVTDEEVESALINAVQAAGCYDVLTEGTVEDGDIANIDYVGKKDGTAFDGGTAEGYDLTIGSNTFIDGFEAGLIGKTIGETTDLNLTFPENYGNTDLAGAEVVFTVTVNSVQRAPEEITDEIAAKASSDAYATVAEYREAIKADLTKTAETNQENTIKSDLVNQLYNTCTINDYPEDLVAYSKQQMTDYYQQMASYYGMEFSDFLTQYFSMTEEEYETEATEAVKSNLKQEMLLKAIAEQENLVEVTEEEYEQSCQDYADQLGFTSVDEFKSSYDEATIKESIVLDRAMNFVYDNANITFNEAEAVTESASEGVASEEAVTEAVTE